MTFVCHDDSMAWCCDVMMCLMRRCCAIRVGCCSGLQRYCLSRNIGWLRPWRGVITLFLPRRMIPLPPERKRCRTWIQTGTSKMASSASLGPLDPAAAPFTRTTTRSWTASTEKRKRERREGGREGGEGNMLRRSSSGSPACLTDRPSPLK